VRAFYLLSVWLHILAATIWIGGMAFLVLVVVPWLRRGNAGNAAAMLRDTGMRFRDVGWVCFGILLLTGSFNLWARGVRVSDFFSVEWRSSPFGKAVLLKLALFVVVLVLSAFHDFFVGPRATQAIERDPSSPEARAWRRSASRLGRTNALFALLLLAVAVTLVRGVPW
jgi:putative copper export protein